MARYYNYWEISINVSFIVFEFIYFVVAFILVGAQL